LTIASKSSRFRENPRRARNTFSHWSRDHSCPIVGRLSTTSDFASYDAIGEAATPASLKGSFTTQTRSTVLSKSDSRGGWIGRRLLVFRQSDASGRGDEGHHPGLTDSRVLVGIIVRRR